MNNVTLIENLPELEYEDPEQKPERLIYERQDSPTYRQQQQSVPHSVPPSFYQHPRGVAQQEGGSIPLSCLDVAGHINDCPICSKLYSCDKSIYLVIIIILAVACMLLLRRVLEK